MSPLHPRQHMLSLTLPDRTACGCEVTPFVKMSDYLGHNGKPKVMPEHTSFDPRSLTCFECVSILSNMSMLSDEMREELRAKAVEYKMLETGEDPLGDRRKPR